MKCNSNLSDETSMGIDYCSLKLKILILVTNTADLINERTTSSLGISHALVAPIALFTTYVFLIIMLIGAVRGQKASFFIQVYAVVTCSSIQTTLSIVVFKDLQASAHLKPVAGQVLNGVLPIFTIILLIADLIAILFSNRDDISAPPLPTDSRSTSHLDIHSERSQ